MCIARGKDQIIYTVPKVFYNTIKDFGLFHNFLLFSLFSVSKTSNAIGINIQIFMFKQIIPVCDGQVLLHVMPVQSY